MLHVILRHASEITHNIAPTRAIYCVSKRNQVSLCYATKRKIYNVVHQIIAMHIDANEVILKH
jgi:PP-loop superfamily ATP-utilizing enzyme